MSTKVQWKKAERVIRSTDRARVGRYYKYWTSIKPRGARDYYDRWLFAFASIRTTWQSNCKIFLALKRLPIYIVEADIERVLRSVGSGMYKVRTRALWEFHLKYWADTSVWLPRRGESFIDARARILPELHDIGLAKTSFFFEMGWPEQCDVVCLDTHLLQLYGLSGSTVSDKKYLELEKHWCETCRKEGLPSPLVRHVYWDKLQKQPDTRYWSHVLHHNVSEFKHPFERAA